jgi:hypothetical protein
VGEGDKQRIFDSVLEQLRDHVGRAWGAGTDVTTLSLHSTISNLWLLAMLGELALCITEVF